MSALDWTVLLGTLFAIIGYGLWKERGAKTAEQYLGGGRDMKWYSVGLSVMATQASAITFLSLPGQAYEDGMGFVQFYFGLPLAMIVLSAVIVPIYFKLKVFTAYEYLETRFDQKTRQLTALLFLLSRGLAAGISISAPAIVLAAVMGWPLRLTTVALGVVVIAYTVTGGTRLVSRTQTYQMVVMLGGMAVAAVVVFLSLPADVHLPAVLEVAGSLGKLNAVDFSPRLDTRYTFWSGITGGFFVALAYFGTDQSQVQRYLTGASLTESRLGLIFNALVKIPMQALILFVGVLVFVFYQYEKPPVFFDTGAWERVHQGAQAGEVEAIDQAWQRGFEVKSAQVAGLSRAVAQGDPASIVTARQALQASAAEAVKLRLRAKEVVKQARGTAEAKDADFIFLHFVMTYFPRGLVGLLLAVILSAAMSATAAALNSLGSTSVVDFYQRSVRPDATSDQKVRAAKGFTIAWGVIAVAFATFGATVDNLIQAVNVLGSIFYGPMLGVFLLGFFSKRVSGTPAFWATIGAQALVLVVWATSSIGFLWYNVIGCAAVITIGWALELARPRAKA